MRMTRQTNSDWCHLCGQRKETNFACFTLPKNAEHSTKDGERGYFRFCEKCVEQMVATCKLLPPYKHPFDTAGAFEKVDSMRTPEEREKIYAAYRWAARLIESDWE